MEQTAKPPYVIFEARAVEDREESLRLGHYAHKDVIYAIITPAGSKDRIEKVAEDWLSDLVEMVNQERFPASWLDAYRQRFESWKKTREIPEDGTPVLNWAAISPSQAQRLLDLNIRTVEQVAEMTEEAVQAVGMGGRALKSSAKAYLETASSIGTVAGKLETLQVEIERLTLRDIEREAELKKLTAENEALKKASK